MKELHHFWRGVTFIPIPRRTPVEIAQAVKQSLQENPNFCDAWHADRLQVLEITVSRMRAQLRIPSVKQLKTGKRGTDA